MLYRNVFDYILVAPSNSSPWSYLLAFLSLPAFSAAAHLPLLEDGIRRVRETHDTCVGAIGLEIELFTLRHQYDRAIEQCHLLSSIEPVRARYWNYRKNILQQKETQENTNKEKQNEDKKEEDSWDRSGQ